ncbi:hypothetical protein DL1_03410 [Thioclava dalianensis]|uniref:Uncharacterized protein n=1 Tax=Thioclava dalianensis TaxID=1185766 RepID=A0A074TCV8_9RHOB|nr:hypothetical protein [Thioclava dalianensis]KEP69539.1 hypothetical protein DL1_03410 [Thioclava dalianensis]SFN69471.1 hypothetical protein SAMN05216224_10996 [Thioclava dalianensis]
MSHFDDLENARVRYEMAEHLEHLFQAGIIRECDQPVYGIARLVQDKGQEILTPKQSWHFRTKVEEPYCRPECWRCGFTISVDQAWDVESGDLNDLCPSCRHDWDRM